MDNIFTKVSFKRCSANEKKLFSSSKCIMPISVGVKIHEGEEFLSTMQLINSSFKACTLLVDDSIQRYTLQIFEPNVSMEQLYIKSIKAGDEWLKRNKKAYQSLTIPYNIMRWDNWYNHAEFRKFYDNVEKLYAADETYTQAIHATIEDFITRNVSGILKDNFDKSHAFDCCLQYLKEECAVMCLWAREGFHFEVYPSGRSTAMHATYLKLISPVYPNLLKSVSLYFEKGTKRTEEKECFQYG